VRQVYGEHHGPAMGFQAVGIAAMLGFVAVQLGMKSMTGAW
jgi:hypothetical protein